MDSLKTGLLYCAVLKQATKENIHWRIIIFEVEAKGVYAVKTDVK